MTLDQVTYDRAKAVIQLATYSGRDKVESLYAAGLLWTPGMEQHLRRDAILFIAKEMAQWEPHEFLRTVKKGLESATPTDMYHAVMAWILKHADHVTQRP